jgi:3-dehydroquinate synthetase
MIAEARMAARMGLGAREVADRLTALLTALEVPRCAGVDRAAAEMALRADKKLSAGRLQLPVVPEIGHVVIREDVPVEELVAALDDGLAWSRDVERARRGRDPLVETEQ